MTFLYVCVSVSVCVGEKNCSFIHRIRIRGQQKMQCCHEEPSFLRRWSQVLLPCRQIFVINVSGQICPSSPCTSFRVSLVLPTYSARLVQVLTICHPPLDFHEDATRGHCWPMFKTSPDAQLAFWCLRLKDQHCASVFLGNEQGHYIQS